MDFCIILQDFFDIFNQVLVGSCEIFRIFLERIPHAATGISAESIRLIRIGILRFLKVFHGFSVGSFRIPGSLKDI